MKVKVWNKNTLPHIETFKGDKIEIPAGGSIEMDWEDAIEFKGQFFPMVINADGTHNPKGFKKIFVERPPQAPVHDLSLVNHADGSVAATRADLDAELRRFDHLAVKDPNLEGSGGNQNAEIAALKEQVAKLAALVEGQVDRKKPGPKPKLKAQA